MLCWRCHSNIVNTGSHLPNISDVKTRKIRNIIGIDMTLNKRIRLAWWRTSQSLRVNLLYPVNWWYSVQTVRVGLGLDYDVLRLLFYNISVISWRSVLLVEETGVSAENHWPVTSHWLTLSHNVASSTSRHERDPN